MTKSVFLILVFSIGISLNILAQESNLSLKKNRYKSIYVEFLGASNLMGISYDTRLSPTSPWGYRIGISYYQGGNKNNNPDRGVFFPIEINYLIGKSKHKFEFGLGSDLGMYNESVSVLLPSEKEANNQPSTIKTKTQTSFAYYLFSNIGYRYLSNRGFLFRAGLCPSFSFKDKYGITKNPSVLPYISFGYSF